MTTLEEQLSDKNLTPMEVLMKLCESLEIEERGGGPEGIYYTHEFIAGEYLFRNLPTLIEQVNNL